ncbi:LPS assembly lipoprotein LptE [Pseudooceanicola algae]|uniref:LPS-assembly lipoprotein n=1 Tax=Pseudooceanicola algae TaxID=1537215 RepID=A0A418SFZ7_9RHOB|nr:LPS assembly lipoprotein LptE [Pseudooceanicola algae]QPM91597.1 hypothetical protein PSAL_028520 [Pseudooceanicola algae]
MWSSDRRSFLATLASGLALGGLAACGFTPSYGPGGGTLPLLNTTRIPAPDSDDSYVLVRELEQRLGRVTAPLYDLTLQLSVGEESLAVTSDNTTTRFNVVGSLTYTLTQIESATEIGSGKVQSFTGYSATGTTVATLASQSDAHERLMVILSDMLVARLTADMALHTQSVSQSAMGAPPVSGQ